MVKIYNLVMATHLFTIATVTYHYQMKDSPSKKFNTENSIALLLIVLIFWLRIKLLVMASHLVTMVTVTIARCEMQAYYFLVPTTISRCEVRAKFFCPLHQGARCEVRAKFFGPFHQGERCEQSSLVPSKV